MRLEEQLINVMSDEAITVELIKGLMALKDNIEEVLV